MQISIRVRTCALAAVFAGLLATGALSCKGEIRKDEKKVAARSAPTQVPDSGPKEVSTRPAVTAAEVRPFFRLIGEEGVVPRQIEISFSQIVFEPEQVNQAVSDKTVLSLSPEVSGRLSRTGPASLLFEPEKPLPPATRLTASLEKLETKDGVLEPPSTDTWNFAFETPAFRLVRVSPHKVNKVQRTLQAELDLVFSAPVDLGSLRQSSRWLIDGAGVTDVSYQGADRPNVARVKLRPSTTKTEAQVQFVMQDGVQLAGDRSVRAPATEERLLVKLGEALTIFEANRKEGASGHFIEVVCDDRAAGGKNYYRWDSMRHDYIYISDRCVLRPEDVETAVHFDPPVQVSVSATRRGFRLLGDFARGSYRMRIDAGARSEDGGVLGETYETLFTVPERSPSVAFGSKGRYLPADSWGNLPLRHLNVDEIMLSVRHVGAQNVVYWLSGESEQTDDRTSDLVFQKTLRVSGQLDEQKTSWIDLEALIPSPERGVYELTVTAKGKRDTARIALTNLNLIAKRSSAPSPDGWGKHLNVWAIDAHTAAPAPDARIKWITKSGRAVAECTSGGDGGCVLEAGPAGEDKSPPFAIVATKGDDFTFLKFSELEVDLEGSQVQGEPYERAAAYAAALYSDRGVYRPGETAHLVGIVRDKSYVAPPAEMPVELVLTDPRGRVLARRALKTNDAGIVAYDQQFADFADTGAYKLSLEIAKTQIAQYGFNVEE
ncbi:MAG: hypothetical protein KDH09_19825, partial [Chrysiogenetes bacterium]|nr:hypothetical protein [Chrysiogenetes bacterium]